MCGIAGLLNKKEKITSQNLQGAIDCLQHRGPDDQGIWISEMGDVGLGHRRLSVIDLSSAAGQPMAVGNHLVIIHNGELYNYLEIKRDLQLKGYRFHTESDTEVIALAYSAWGKDCLSRFDGMFAFAIWDKTERTLFAARDRFGEKPFFFYYDETKMLFASEMKALWKMGVDKKVNGSMLYNFLTIGYTANPAEPQETFFENIRKLPAASSLLYSMDTHQLEIERYWDLEVEEKQITDDTAIEQFKALLTDSVKKRMRSDVEIGTSLSGGLDSSAIVAFCDKAAGSHYSHKCFTASFTGFEKDETASASKVARQFGLEHHLVTIGEQEVVELMEKLMRSQEEPFSSASPLAQFKVYETAKAYGVTVLLDGQGADEIMAGYGKYYQWYWRELYRKDRRKLTMEMRSASALGIKEKLSIGDRIASYLPEFSAGISQALKSRKAQNQHGLDSDFLFRNKRNLYYTTPTRFDLNGVLYYNTMVNGLEELLRLADRNSMAHATEIRLPYLSHQLVEFLFSLPPQMKIRDGWTKWILRKASGPLLPEEIAWRKDKIGFEPPQQQWMQNSNVQQAIIEGKKLLANEGILDRSAIHAIKPHSAYAANGADWKLWSASLLFQA